MNAATATELGHAVATRYVTPFREGGSMPGLMEADDDGLYVVKFRGAGQGAATLASELIAASLATEIGLNTPRLTLIDVDPALGVAEPDAEIKELLTTSAGVNLGSDFLPGATTYSPAAGLQPGPELAADVVMFDALLTNVDRTAQNPNLLVWHGDLWLIDHGAAIYLQHAGLSAETAEREFPQIAEHVLLPTAGPIADAAGRFSSAVDDSAIERAVGRVPAEWLRGDPETYVEYLTGRFARADVIAEEAERARG